VASEPKAEASGARNKKLKQTEPTENSAPSAGARAAEDDLDTSAASNGGWEVNEVEHGDAHALEGSHASYDTGSECVSVDGSTANMAQDDQKTQGKASADEADGKESEQDDSLDPEAIEQATMMETKALPALQVKHHICLLSTRF